MNFSDIFSKLVFVFPEIQLDDKILKLALDNGWISQRDWADFVRARRIGKRIFRVARRLDEKSILQRIMLVAPEIMSRDTVDILRQLDLISVSTGHALRAGFSAVGGIKATFVSDKDIASRIFRLLDDVNSESWISFLRSLDEERIAEIRASFLRRRLGPDWKSMPGVRLNKLESMFVQDKILESIRRAEMLRAMVLAGKATNSAVRSALKAQGVWDVMTIFAHTIFGAEFLRAAVKTGVIDPGKYNTIRALEKMGLNLWRKGFAAADYEGWYARGLMISEGILSPETIAAAKQLGWIDARTAAVLNYGATFVRSVTRGQLDMIGPRRKYRVTPGETPLQTYARVSKVTDDYLIKLLRDSANESRKAAELAYERGLIGAKTRAAQQTLVAREMHKEMRSLAEKLGPLLIFGEREVAGAAVDSMEFLQRDVLGRMTEEDRLSLRLTARSGLDNMVSRAENRKKLSRLVYRNLSAWNGAMDREINIALLRGLSAKEFAQRIERMIRPDTPGGISYAAMRLARTEINNAFHWTQIRYTREMPWVEAYQWHLSRSHGKADVCNTMASDDHEGLGAGVYKKTNVPGKPHPHCLCFVTAVTKKPGEFEKQYLRGSYDKYMTTMRKGGLFDDPYADTAASVRDQVFNQVLPVVRKQAQDVAITLGASLVVSALRNPVAAAAFATNAMQGFTDLATRMGRTTNSATRTPQTKGWLAREIGAAEAEDLLPGLPMRQTLDEVPGYDLSDFKPWVEPIDLTALVAGMSRDDILESIEIAEDVLGDKDGWSLERLRLYLTSRIHEVPYRNLVFGYSDELREAVEDESAYDFLADTLDAHTEGAIASDLAKSLVARDMYAGAGTYTIINRLLRENGGATPEFASAVNEWLEDYHEAIRVAISGHAESLETGDDSIYEEAWKAILNRRPPPGQRDDLWEFAADFVHKTTTSEIEREAGDLVSPEHEFINSGLSVGEWLRQGLAAMTRIHELEEDRVVFRSSTSEFVGVAGTDYLPGQVGKVVTDGGVVSTEVSPRYYTQTVGWYTTARYRIFLPQGTLVGVGALEEYEMLLPPGSRFLVLSATQGRQMSETGLPIWDVDLLALPPA